MVRILIVISSFSFLFSCCCKTLHTKLESIWSCHWTISHISFVHPYSSLSRSLPPSHTNNYYSHAIALILCMFHCSASPLLLACIPASRPKINGGRNFMKNKIQRCAKIWKEVHSPCTVLLPCIVTILRILCVEIEWLKVWFLVGVGTEAKFILCALVGEQNTKQHTTKTWYIDVVVFWCWNHHIKCYVGV